MNCKCECNCVKKPTHICCEQFDLIKKTYDPVTRTYTIDGEIAIRCCPACGTDLPKSLQEEWRSTLHKEYGVEDYYASIWNPMVPEEFKSDTWWKKRNL